MAFNADEIMANHPYSLQGWWQRGQVQAGRPATWGQQQPRVPRADGPGSAWTGGWKAPHTDETPYAGFADLIQKRPAPAGGYRDYQGNATGGAQVESPYQLSWTAPAGTTAKKPPSWTGS